MVMLRLMMMMIMVKIMTVTKVGMLIMMGLTKSNRSATVENTEERLFAVLGRGQNTCLTHPDQSS